MLCVVSVASALALAAAYVAEFVFDLKPCHLCLMQRPPYWAALVLGVLGWSLAKTPRLAMGALAMATLAVAVGAGIAWYHSGVERGWWQGPSGCTADGSLAGSIEELKAAILGSPVVACNQPAFEFLGLSMANMNALYATAIILAAVYAARRPRTP